MPRTFSGISFFNVFHFLSNMQEVQGVQSLYALIASARYFVLIKNGTKNSVQKKWLVADFLFVQLLCKVGCASVIVCGYLLPFNGKK